MSGLLAAIVSRHISRAVTVFRGFKVEHVAIKNPGIEGVDKVVAQLESLERTQTRHHRKVYRPWGWYDSVDSGDRFKVKRIQVKPGARLSVQMHRYRSEHWAVVRGAAEVLNGDSTTVSIHI